ncbi:MAG: hypothetical protein GY868_01870, partial [Deltaproteobacteria bacterium]|nr:hypothetical protein [Deltaproteobacteria bacterium]
VENQLLYEHHRQKNRQDENKRFRLFIVAQIVQYAGLLLLVLGGLFLIVLGLRILL